MFIYLKLWDRATNYRVVRAVYNRKELKILHELQRKR